MAYGRKKYDPSQPTNQHSRSTQNQPRSQHQHPQQQHPQQQHPQHQHMQLQQLQQILWYLNQNQNMTQNMTQKHPVNVPDARYTGFRQYSSAIT